MKKILRPALLIASLGGVPAVHSQSPQSAAPSASQGMPRAGGQASTATRGEAERDFVNAVALIDKAEMEAAQIALSRSRTPRVRDLAQDIVAGHEWNYAALNNVAERELIPGAALGATGMHMIAELREASDESFDRVYIASTLRSHADALSQLERDLSALDDEALRGCAERSLGLLRGHRDRAREIETLLLAAPPASRTRR